MAEHIDRKTQYAITTVVVARCTSDADGFAIYDEGQTDRTIAAEVAATREQVATIRRAWFGNFRTLADGIPETAPTTRYDARLAAIEEHIKSLTETLATVIDSQEVFTDMISNFRSVMAGHGQKIEAIRKIADVAGVEQLEAIYRAKDRLEVLLIQGPADRDDLFKLMRGEGFPEGVTQSALVLLGAVIQGDSITGPEAPGPKAVPDREDTA